MRLLKAPWTTATRTAPAIIAAGALVLALAAPAAHAGAASPLEQQAFHALREHPVFIEGSASRLADRARLTYAARIASRAADGAEIKLAVVSVPSSRLVALRDRLYRRLRLRVGGALVMANRVAITMRTSTLTPGQQAAILQLDGRMLRDSPGQYTDVLAELTYDTGLVMHNSTPGVLPRGDGPDRNLKTFTGHFPGESQPPRPVHAAAPRSIPFAEWALYGFALAAVLALAVKLGLLRRRVLD